MINYPQKLIAVTVLSWPAFGSTNVCMVNYIKKLIQIIISAARKHVSFKGQFLVQLAVVLLLGEG